MMYEVDHDPGAPFAWRIVRTRHVGGDDPVTVREVFAHFRTKDDACAYMAQIAKGKP